MDFITNIYTDIGIRKKTNQDSSSVMIANTLHGKVCMAIICDGMGGLEKGELASAHIIKSFKQWFCSDFPSIINGAEFDNIKYQWNEIVQKENEHIAKYGSDIGVAMGTTLTVSLFVNEKIYIMHVGDTRFYEITDDELFIHTEDQTLVAREIRRGNMTPEEAAVDPRRNVLLQCIGASRVVEPQYVELEAHPGNMYMLCSDGFRHKISEDEIIIAFRPSANADKAALNNHSVELVELNKKRKESDNITVLLVKTMN